MPHRNCPRVKREAFFGPPINLSIGRFDFALHIFRLSALYFLWLKKMAHTDKLCIPLRITIDCENDALAGQIWVPSVIKAHRQKNQIGLTVCGGQTYELKINRVTVATFQAQGIPGQVQFTFKTFSQIYMFDLLTNYGKLLAAIISIKTSPSPHPHPHPGPYPDNCSRCPPVYCSFREKVGPKCACNSAYDDSIWVCDPRIPRPTWTLASTATDPNQSAFLKFAEDLDLLL